MGEGKWTSWFGRRKDEVIARDRYSSTHSPPGQKTPFAYSPSSPYADQKWRCGGEAPGNRRTGPATAGKYNLWREWREWFAAMAAFPRRSTHKQHAMVPFASVKDDKYLVVDSTVVKACEQPCCEGDVARFRPAEVRFALVTNRSIGGMRMSQAMRLRFALYVYEI